jgi:hypothetical protein
MFNDISKDFRWNPTDARIGRELIKLQETPEAIKRFAAVCDDLTDYGYWFYLSTLWVSYTGFSDLNLWRRLFSSDRPRRQTSIMKPSELAAYKRFPYFVTAYRAHRPGETEWLSYTLDKEIACRFAAERGVDSITEYRIKKRDVLALFLRRDEQEILVLDHRKAEKVREYQVIWANG